MMVNTILAHRHAASGISRTGAEPGATRPRGSPSYFTVLAFAVWFVVTWQNTARAHAPLVLAVEATLFILSIYLLRVPEVSLLGHGYLLVAQGIWTYGAFAGTGALPGWNVVSMIVLTIGLGDWWRKQSVLKLQTMPDPDLTALLKLSVLGKNVVLLAGMHIAVGLAGGWELEGRGLLWAYHQLPPMGSGR